MAFLFQDQNQGIRNDISHPQMRGAAATVLFHPDFNRRLRIHTESADPFSLVPQIWFPKEEGARGLGLRHPYRRWGLSPRPENIGCPAGQPAGKYDQTPTWEQVPPAWGFGMSPMCPQRVSWAPGRVS